MELRENRTELERLLGDVWDYQDGGHEKAHLPKWLFALTLAAAVTCTSSPSDIVVPVKTALAPAPEKLSIDTVSSQNVAEDLDYRIARHTDSVAGWRAFLAAHPDGPHAEAARAAIGEPQPAPRPPDQSQAPTQTADDTAPSPAATPVMVEEEERAPPQPVEVAKQAPPPSAAMQTPAVASQFPATPSPAPAMVKEEEAAAPARPVEVAEQSPPSSPATQAPIEAAPSVAAPAVMAEAEPAPPEPVAALADAPLPPSRPRVIAAAKPVEPAEPTHHSHWRAVHHQADRPNALTVLIAQLFHRRGQGQDLRSR